MPGKMGKIAFIFPGQGAQYVGMAKELAEAYPESKLALEEAGDGAGLDLVGLCCGGPEDHLNLTENTQPAVLAASAAALAPLAAAGLVPSYTAGLSLGEYTALVASRALSLFDAAKVVRKRGRLMQEAVPAGEGGMAAVMGLSAEDCRTACNGLECQPANFNCPGQVVISGRAAAVKAAAERCSQLGAKKVIPLRVSAPFHSELMRPVAPLLDAEFDGIRIRDADPPVIANCTARPVTKAAEIRRRLLEQVYASVYWEDSVRWMAADGVDTFVEIGPSKVLSGFVKRIAPQATILSVEDCTTLDATMAALEGRWTLAVGGR